MPVYICQAGSNSTEPWRHGLQVYAAPFPLTDGTSGDYHETNDDAVLVPHTLSSTEVGDQTENANNANNLQPQRERQIMDADNPDFGISIDRSQDGRFGSEHSSSKDNENANRALLRFGLPVRRIRHAEVVLVDDVCIAYDRHWLRLRWPGYKGGFAGYVALGKVNETSVSKKGFDMLQSREIITPLSSIVDERGGVDHTMEQDISVTAVRQLEGGDSQDGMGYGEDQREGIGKDNDDGNKEDELQDNASALSSEPNETNSTFCLRTGIAFPTSGYMKLMPTYDDGLSPAVSSSPFPSEQIFCRICREGLHDDADDEQPSTAMENEVGETKEDFERFPSNDSLSDNYYDRGSIESSNTKGPVKPHPVYQSNSHAMENPLISPCECSGSMAFVHYLCIEQWRCRSRHPKARRGLNCETCGKPYALPPPSARPVDNEDWLEAMPPHVIDALRQPHIWWQIGAAIVRRRWLRPIAPVIMSPIVALYCCARRLLKKKGVARRRWACSLCRRRARWKCVRCLRSYYCSRQCQNVSWHIVHKHLCYKPSRWFSSLLVYGIATLAVFPGILRDPLVYDLGFSLIPLSFYVMAILGGGIATALKKSFGLDLRGRTFEVGVIILTICLVILSLGLLSAFFGDSSRCYGALGSLQLSENDQLYQFLRRIQKSILEPAKNWFLMWDRAALSSGTWPRKILCMPRQDVGCFEHLHSANSDFLFDDVDGGRCSMDMVLVSSLYQGAALVAAGNHYWKRRERQRRAARRPRRR